MAQQSVRRGRKIQMYSSCLEHAFMIWFRSANSHTGPQLHRCIRGRTDGSIRLSANLRQKPLALGGASTDEYTAQPTRNMGQLIGILTDDPPRIQVIAVVSPVGGNQCVCGELQGIAWRDRIRG